MSDKRILTHDGIDAIKRAFPSGRPGSAAIRLLCGHINAITEERDLLRNENVRLKASVGHMQQEIAVARTRQEIP